MIPDPGYVTSHHVKREDKMDCSYLLENENMTMYECSKRSGIPYSTLSDIIKGRTAVERVSSGHLNALAETLGLSMDELYSLMHVPERTSFETFKSQVRHEVRRLGDSGFISETAEEDKVRKYWRWEWYLEAFYLLATLDYLCRENNMKTLQEYDDLREYRLPEPVYPMDVNVAAKIDRKFDVRKSALKESIPEFRRFNIVEKDIRDVY